VREKVTVEVDGLAASISSIIAMAGKKLVMREGTFLMIHNPWTMMAGGSDDLRKEADVLDKIKDQLVGIYQNKTNLKASDIEAMMKEETWMTPTEARAMGFADEVVTASRIAASYNKGLIEYGFKHTPISETPNATATSAPIVTPENVTATNPEEIKDISATVEEPITVDYTEQTNALRAKILKFKINKINGDDTEVD
jgi:ATP-dependent Clp protease protease subunit